MAFLYDLEGGFIKRLHVPFDVMYQNGLSGITSNSFGLGISIGSGVIAVSAVSNDRNTSNGKTSGNVFIFDLNGNYLFDLRAGYEKTIRPVSDYYKPTNSSPAESYPWVHKRDSAISASTYDPSDLDNQGNPNGSNWNLQGFGHSVSVGFGKIVVGCSNFELSSAGNYDGAVLVFDLNGKLLTSYIASNTNDNLHFGASVSSDYGKILITEPGRTIVPYDGVGGGAYPSHMTRPRAWNTNTYAVNKPSRFKIQTGDTSIPGRVTGYTENVVCGGFYSLESDPIMTPWDLLELENGWA
jgi:hypothetical protein